MNGMLLTGTPEIACSVSTGSTVTSGGGFSNQLIAPSFQKDAIKTYFSHYKPMQAFVPYLPSHRGYPDISMPGNAYSKYVAFSA